ncbi:MAG: hypothetical protein ACREEL_08375 [Stellaceae bacterium]
MSADTRENSKAGCLWCGKPFEPRGYGSPQKFCSPAHRRAFETAALQYVARMVAIGQLTVEAIKGAIGDESVHGSGSRLTDTQASLAAEDRLTRVL